MPRIIKYPAIMLAVLLIVAGAVLALQDPISPRSEYPSVSGRLTSESDDGNAFARLDEERAKLRLAAEKEKGVAAAKAGGKISSRQVSGIGADTNVGGERGEDQADVMTVPGGEETRAQDNSLSAPAAVTGEDKAAFSAAKSERDIDLLAQAVPIPSADARAEQGSTPPAVQPDASDTAKSSEIDVSANAMSDAARNKLSGGTADAAEKGKDLGQPDTSGVDAQGNSEPFGTASGLVSGNGDTGQAKSADEDAQRDAVPESGISGSKEGDEEAGTAESSGADVQRGALPGKGAAEAVNGGKETGQAEAAGTDGRANGSPVEITAEASGLKSPEIPGASGSEGRGIPEENSKKRESGTPVLTAGVPEVKETHSPQKKNTGDAPRKADPKDAVTAARVYMDGEIIRMRVLAASPMSSTVFSLKNPPRVVLDLDKPRSVRGVQNDAPSGVKRIRYAEHSGKTRIVLDLTSAPGKVSRKNIERNIIEVTIEP